MNQRILLRSIAIIGISLSLCILVSLIYSWLTASFGVFPLIVYIYIFMCANKKRRRVFLRAGIALGCLTIIDFLLFVLFLVIGILELADVIKTNSHETKIGLEVQDFLCAFIALLLACYMTFTLVFVEKARRHVFQTNNEIPMYPFGYNDIVTIDGAPPRYSVVLNDSASFSSPT